MKFVCPLITVSDISVSREFYENILNQKVKHDFGENVTYHGDFAIHLRSHFKELIDDKPIVRGGNNFELYFEFDDVDSLARILKNYGVIFVHEVREQPWRQKVVRFYDPDENIIEVGESMKHLVTRLKGDGFNVDRISEITGLPLAFVSELLNS
ncbi:glyoxalase/bleomycin resistance/dioxygenase family protein [Puteibacter caeruleilacunae]|nr:glyoxalase/bleomycin resistance/dioxygenase family protein [Puteibacter caeruleilacunae]